MGLTRTKKNKGRPPKSDPPETDRLRRSLRRRNVKYVFDLDDYFDEDEVFENDEDRRRREKKLKHLLKLQGGGGELRSRGEHAPLFSASSSESGENPSKKRKIIDEIDEDVDEENDEDRYNEENEDEVTGKKQTEDSNPGTPTDGVQGMPLPEKKTLELICDKLQKKDIYGVYAEPVDPEELPDYHDIIEHPMDFATVRKKLGNGSYVTLEQFEADVFLICSNAMQYNAPDTIYHKQARSIKELAMRKFQKIRSDFENSDKHVKSDQKLRSTPLLKKPIHGSVINSQGPPGSDFSSYPVDLRHIANASQVLEFERHGNADALLTDGNYTINENTFDKGDESLPGKGMVSSKFGKKSSMQDENRRDTYSISLANNVSSSESMFSTFDGESKQLIPVGLYADHSYARSLARFAASLGSVIWKITSKRIEQALPQGFSYGRGWVGEYEPPSPVLRIENFKVKEPPFFTKQRPAVETRKHEDALFTTRESPGYAPLPFLDRSGITSCSNASFPAKEQSSRVNVNASDMSSSFFLSSRMKPGGSGNMISQQHVSQFRASMESDQRGLKQFQQNAPPPFNISSAHGIRHRQNLGITETEHAKSIEFASRNGSFSTPDNGVAAVGALSNGRVPGRLDGDTITSSSIGMAKIGGYYQHEQGHVMNDPGSSVMRMLAEKSQNQQRTDSRPQILSSAPLSSGNGPAIAAATAAARAWMSVGAGGFRPPPCENRNTLKNQIPGGSSPYHSQAVQFREESPSPGGMSNPLVHAFVPQGPMPFRVGNGVPPQNQAMVYPHLGAADLSRFQLQQQPTWRGLSPRQRHESLPPDLNIGFQPSGSPGGPSSGILVDSQQPDLALQL